jgi:hypothetical protein
MQTLLNSPTSETLAPPAPNLARPYPQPAEIIVLYISLPSATAGRNKTVVEQ